MRVKDRQKQSLKLTKFAGVALADILANGVAMVIILIVITIALKHQEEQKKITEIADVTLLLSRDISSSVVMNSLPSSGPAVLHDYENSYLDKNPNPKIMPIIELHTDFVRDYYSKEIFSREQLLQQDNAFDQFLKSMSKNQRRRIRVDIYDIPLFYIVMSIIRNYGRLPSHWHFLGQPKSLTVDKSNVGNNEKEENAEPQISEQGEQGEQGEKSDKNGTSDKIWQSFPQDVSLAQPDKKDPYPFDDFAYDSENAGKPIDAMDESELSDKVFDTLTKMFSGEISSSAGHRLPNVVRFRTAKPSEAKSSGEKNEEIMKLLDKKNGKSLPVVYTNLIISLFNFMQFAEQEIARGNYSVLENFNFYKNIVIPSLSIKMPMNNEQKRFFLSIVNHLITLSEKPEKIYIDKLVSETSNALKVPINLPIPKSVFMYADDQKQYSFLPGKADIHLNLGLYPTIYKGISTPLNQSHIILALADKKTPQQKRWRIVSITNSKKGDFLLGFVYGYISEDNQLVISSNENAIKLDNFLTFTAFSPITLRKEKELFLILGAVTLLLLLGILHRFRRLA